MARWIVSNEHQLTNNIENCLKQKFTFKPIDGAPVSIEIIVELTLLCNTNVNHKKLLTHTNVEMK